MGEDRGGRGYESNEVQTNTASPPLAEAGATAPRRQAILRLALVVLLTAGITFLAITFRHQLGGLEALGYPGVFLVSLLANATVVLPAPGLAFTFAMGPVLNPLLVGLVAGAGEALGEMTGYLAGRAGRTAIGQDSRYERLERITRRYGGWAILALSAIPAAVFDLVGLAAGAMRMPVLRFLLFTLVGKTIKTIAVAYAGAYSVTWLLDLIN
ncbi:MAG: VTT domain-containing protein [Anaerolineae bacterium]|nr:VTT domain-containing protein [Anaerolineae bacterium]